MLRDAAVELEESSTWELQIPHGDQPHWRRVDRALRSLAQRRSAVDAEEARWLREAESCQIWRPLGMVSAIDYMERVLGYGPRVAQERLRVARALGTLPELTEALTQGEISYSAVRELTRVVTPATEAAWRAAAVGKNLRQIEALVADHQPGDNPDDPGNPEIRTHVVRFELSAETFAVLRQARQVLDEEHGSHLSDDELVAALSGAVLDGSAAAEPTGRARFQIAVTLCERCGQGWQDGAGARLAIDDASVERALCDAQHIGSLDGGVPQRAHQDIPPSVARLVWRRDGGRCRVPGCRSARNLEIHHLVHRTDGGSHDAMNLILACGSCHMAHHRGILTISGTADRVEVERRAHSISDTSGLQTRDRGAHVDASTQSKAGESKTAAAKTTAAKTSVPRTAPANTFVPRTAPANTTQHTATPNTTAPNTIQHTTELKAADSKLDTAIVRAQTKDALVSLGWTPSIATAAVATAVAMLGTNVTLEQLIREALRRCPLPKA